MNPTSDSFSFNNMTSAGMYVYIPMTIMTILFLVNIRGKFKQSGILDPRAIFMLLGFLVGNMAYHNIDAWSKMDGKRIKMSGLIGWIGGFAGLAFGVWLKKKKGMAQVSQIATV